MTQILLFQCDEKIVREIRQILVPMKINCQVIPQTEFHRTLGEIADGKEDEGYFGGEYPQESLLVMCGFSDKQMDRLLLELRRKEIKIDYKAVLTRTNRDWDINHLYFEMRKEKIMHEMAVRDRNLFSKR